MTQPYHATATVVVELGIGASRTPGAPSIWGTGRWGTAHWSGYEPLWREVDCSRLLAARSAIGRERSWDDYGIGTLSVDVLNEDGAFTWNPAIAPESNPVRPGDQLRVGVLVDGDYYPLARAYVESITEGYEGLELVSATLNAQDAMAQLNRGQVPPRAAQGANEFADQRINRILDAASWPKAWRFLEPGITRLQPTTFADPFGAEMTAATDAGGGSIFADRNNRIVFRNRSWEYEQATTPVLAIGPGLDICPTVYEVARDVDDIANQVMYQRVGGTLQVASDTNSQRTYGLRTLERTDLITAQDGDVLILAQNELARRSSAPVVVRAVEFELWADSPITEVAQLELGDLVTVKYVHPREGWAWQKDLHVQSIQHELSPSQWLVRLSVDDLGAYQEVDRWDSARWGSSHWS